MSGDGAREAPMRGSVALIVFIVICVGGGAAGARFTAPAIATWYRDLVKPPWNPPAWVFGPVWTVLYLCMAMAGWRVWQAADSRRRRLALGLFALQLGLNFAWSPIFFGLRRPGLAAVDIILLWFAIAAFCAVARPVSIAAAALFVPYGLWVTFATALNLAIWKLNQPPGPP
jgi:tryptophan-rich sensory protein